MDWELELLFASRAIGASLLGALIGWERERHEREAGIRTYAAVSLGACVFGLISAHVSVSESADPTRIAAQVVTGVGFLGAGLILREQGRIRGLTTAATVWATASVGLAIAFGMYILGTLATLIVLGLLVLNRVPTYAQMKKKLAARRGMTQPMGLALSARRTMHESSIAYFNEHFPLFLR